MRCNNSTDIDFTKKCLDPVILRELIHSIEQENCELKSLPH